MKLLVLLVLSTGLYADTVNITGDRVEVKNGQGTTVIEGANARAAGQAVGETAKAASELGIGIAEAFGGKGTNVKVNRGRGTNNVVVKSPSGTITDRTVVRNRNGKVISGDNTVVVESSQGSTGSKIVVDQNNVVVEDRDDDMSRDTNTLTGTYTVSVAGTDGSAGNYQGATDVEMLKDGTLENNAGDVVSYSGAVNFLTANGEKKHLTGIISVTRE